MDKRPLILIIFLYFLVRVVYPSTIEFGHDQPILADQVINFINNPTFINSYRFVLENPWGYPSWGAMQIFFWVPFLLISKDPLVLSILAIIFNSLGVIFIYLVGYKFYSKKVAIIAGLFFALNPWSIIFSRMIYQPTPVLTLIPILMYLTLDVLKNQKSKLLLIIPFAFGFVYQVYVHTIAFILISVIAISIQFKKLNKKYIVYGIAVSLIAFVPMTYFFVKNPGELIGFIRVSSKFTDFQNESPYGLKQILFEFIGTLGGGRMSWQLGYGYEDFIKTFGFYKFIEFLGSGLVITSLIYGVIKKRLLLVFWALSPIIFLTIVNTPIALPRYFLISLAPLSILVGIFIEAFFNKKIFRFLIGMVLVLWLFFILSYFKFVKNYDYSNGFLSHYSDIPYSFVKEAFNWVKADAIQKKYSRLEIEVPNQASSYYQKNIFNYKNSEGFVGRYKITLSSDKEEILNPRQQFGPYVVFEISN